MARCRPEHLSAPPVSSQFGGGDTATLRCSLQGSDASSKSKSPRIFDQSSQGLFRLAGDPFSPRGRFRRGNLKREFHKLAGGNALSPLSEACAELAAN